MKVANFVGALAFLCFGAASCDVLDPWDPGDGGHGGGGGGGYDTVIVDPPVEDSTGQEEGTFIRAEGTIVHLFMGGEFYGIIADDGKQYEPMNLPEELLIDGQRISFTGNVLGDYGLTAQWGAALELVTIEKR